ncbi:MAG TPA: hypothetical protein VMT17_17400 [Anaeromyxobacteraceae bacterium]|nr:hypothetical protein [Anaeromyxobacteraceae bacterium]
MNPNDRGPLVLDQTPQEFFRELVAGAIGHRRLKVQEHTEFYLVSLLARFLARDELFASGPDEAGCEPLALLLLRALSEGRQRRYQGLRRLGDTSLFVSGFFGDSLARSSVDVDYYIAMGERAYDALAASAAPAAASETFGELSQRFEQFVDLFAEIAEMQELRSNRGLVRLYERFLHTGSERVAQQLRARGVALFAGPNSRVLKH